MQQLVDMKQLEFEVRELNIKQQFDWSFNIFFHIIIVLEKTT